MSLIILAHPNLENSTANKTIINALDNTRGNIEIRDLQKLYPDNQIDVKEEQARLLKHQLIILQFPMYWFSIPAILQGWFEQVFTYQFAYGINGDKLKNKILLPSLTVGQPEKNYIKTGQSFMDGHLSALKRSAEYAQMKYADPIITYDIATIAGHTALEIQNKAVQHASILSDRIEYYSSMSF